MVVIYFTPERGRVFRDERSTQFVIPRGVNVAAKSGNALRASFARLPKRNHFNAPPRPWHLKRVISCGA